MEPGVKGGGMRWGQEQMPDRDELAVRRWEHSQEKAFLLSPRSFSFMLSPHWHHRPAGSRALGRPDDRAGELGGWVSSAVMAPASKVCGSLHICGRKVPYVIVQPQCQLPK